MQSRGGLWLQDEPRRARCGRKRIGGTSPTPGEEEDRVCAKRRPPGDGLLRNARALALIKGTSIPSVFWLQEKINVRSRQTHLDAGSPISPTLWV